MPLWTPDVSLDGPDEINGLTDKAVPVGADALLIEDSADAWSKKKVRIDRVAPATTTAEATGTITTTSGTDVLVTSMTLTPEAGTYLVSFTGSCTNGTSGALTYISIWYNGAQVVASERRFSRGTQAVTAPFVCAAKIAVSGALAIEGRWRTSGGSTGTIYQRVLSVVKVS
jgi:hypothetical protein